MIMIIIKIIMILTTSIVRTTAPITMIDGIFDLATPIIIILIVIDD